jgi:Domain of unknown function (DUF4276)
MVKITIYVEGGGDTNTLKTKCRQGYSEFFKKLNARPKIVACGGRQNAYNSFCKGLKHTKNNEHCLLLVDSEAPITADMCVWQHVFLREGDKWEKPDNSTEEHLHFMVECMEAWFMADKQALVTYYGKDFKQNALPQNTTIEAISKSDLYAGLNKATKDTSKGTYSKGSHSFEILSKIDANKVIESSPHAKKLHDRLLTLLTPSS